MLKTLTVRDFAIIEDLSVSFDEGMTVLTGETGAGKSLIIDTISLLLGARADSDMIRYGKKSASIHGTFTVNDCVNSWLEANSIPKKDELLIERSITDTSKNTVKINGVGVTLAQLKSLASRLADIHVQNDTYKLFNPEGYLGLLDSIADGKYPKVMGAYSAALMDYLEEIRTYEKIVRGQKSLEERLEFLKYEKEELEGLGLYEGIDTQMSEKIEKLSNFDKIKNSLSEAYNVLDGESSSIDSLYEAAKSLERISSYDASYKEYSEKLMDAYYISDEIKSGIYRSLDEMDYDEDELNALVEKLNDIDHAKEKYKKNVSEMIAYLKEITLEIDMAENYDETLKEHHKLVCDAHKKLTEASASLTEYRKRMSSGLTDGIISECRELDLPNTDFRVEFREPDLSDPLNKAPFTESGTDLVDFLITFNKGEPLKPLYKVASGGEASRIMLAFKTYFARVSPVSLMVFDEIDTGVSGSTASKIARKMKQISEHIQVLCITHLPQVAATGDCHKHIYKVEEDGRTKTEIRTLEGKARIEEVARMLSGDTLSLYALEHARELIDKK